jgi:hypothetical protein
LRYREMKAEAVIEVRFKTTAEGGRRTDIVGYIYGCPLSVDGKKFDCRMVLDGKTLKLGETYELLVEFLWPDLALPELSPGKDISLWEGREIATGRVLRLVEAMSSGAVLSSD